MTDRFVPEDVIADRFERLRVVLERSALARHEARVGAVESVLVEGPSKRDDSRWSGRTTQNKLVHFEPRRRQLRDGWLRRRADHPRRPAPPHRRRGRRDRRAEASHPHPGCSALGTSSCSGRRARASRRSRWRSRAPRPEFEIVSVDAMCVYRGMDIGTAKPSPTEQAEVPHHLHRHRRSVGRLHGDAVPDRPRPRRCATSRRAASARCSSAAPACTCAPRSTGSTVPPQFPDVRVALEAEPDTAALYRRLAALDPQAATKMEPTNRRRIVRALEVCVGAGRPFSSLRARPRRVSADAVSPRSGCGPGVTISPAGSTQRFRRMLDGGLVDEVRALAAAPSGMSRTARQALGYRQLLEHVEGGAPLDACIDEAIRATMRFARRQRAWFRRDPRIAWLPCRRLPSQLRSASADGRSRLVRCR